MVKGTTRGLTVAAMMASILKTRSTGMESIDGPMASSTKANGGMENSMAKVNLQMLRASHV
jgi:hypothetical protein